MESANIKAKGTPRKDYVLTVKVLSHEGMMEQSWYCILMHILELNN